LVQGRLVSTGPPKALPYGAGVLLVTNAPVAEESQRLAAIAIGDRFLLKCMD
jgi:hypothetical protein